MNKKIILALTAVALLTTSAMAYPGAKGNLQGSANYKACKTKQHNKYKNSKMFVNMIMRLDLTQKQKDEIDLILKSGMKDMPNPSKAFSDKSFDKKEFIKLSKDKRDARIERRADMLEKIYKVLDSTQKKDLKTMLDMREIMLKQKNRD